MSRGGACIRRGAAVATAVCMLLTSRIGAAEVQIESSPETAALAQVVRGRVSEAPRRVAELDARVTIGAAAFRAALNNNDGRPVVAAYVTTSEFAEALGAAPRGRHITAIFSNPDPLDELILAKTILSRARVAAFDSSTVHSLVSRLTEHGVSPIPVSHQESIDALLRAADPFDVILALPDGILNGANIGHVVRTLYQQHKVLIGYSDTLTRVGSLASVYPTPEGIARAVRDILQQYAVRGVMPAPLFVSDVDVSVNERLAHSLNIVLPDRADLVMAVRSKSETAP